jgi:hypothetical protein
MLQNSIGALVSASWKTALIAVLLSALPYAIYTAAPSALEGSETPLLYVMAAVLPITGYAALMLSGIGGGIVLCYSAGRMMRKRYGLGGVLGMLTALVLAAVWFAVASIAGEATYAQVIISFFHAIAACISGIVAHMVIAPDSTSAGTATNV